MAGERRQRSGWFRSSWTAALRRRPDDKAETAIDTSTAGTPPPEAPPPSGVETAAPPVKPESVEGSVSTLEMADVYRSLVSNLRDKLGGTINDANADVIAHAAAQVYRQEVEPRLWEEKSAHEVLDGLGVPRSGAFVPYSLSDRLLLLRRRGTEDAYRAQAHELLDALGVPRHDEGEREYSLQARLTRLLGSFDGVAGTGAAAKPDGVAGTGAAAKPDGAAGTGAAAKPDGAAGPGGEGEGNPNGESGGDEARAGPDLVDALEAIHRAVGPTDDDDDPDRPLAPPAPPPPPAPDLIGLGGLLGTIQEEILAVRQAVESLRQEVRDAVALFEGGAGAASVPPVVPAVPLTEGGSEIVVRRLDDGPEAVPSEEGSPEAVAAAAAPDFVPPESGSPNGEGGEAGTPDTALTTPVPAEGAGADGVPEVPIAEGPAGPHDPTQVLPAVPLVPDGAERVEEPGVEEAGARPRRSRRFVVLVLLVILIGALLAAGVTAAIVLGWDELESRFLDAVTTPVWSGSGAAP